MARLTIFSVTIVLVIFAMSNVSSSELGYPWCTRSIQCNTRYCRNGQCIRYGTSPDDVGPHPCASVLCIGGYECVIEQVQCYRPPCRPKGTCVRSLPECTDSAQCRSGYCRYGLCINFGDSPDDVGVNPCSRVRCPGRCVLDTVQCVRSPCPPIARCLAPVKG